MKQRPTPTPTVYHGYDTMQSQELLWELAGHRDADVTIAIGTMLLDVYAVSYRDDREKFVLHVDAGDLADAVRELSCAGLKPQTEM